MDNIFNSSNTCIQLSNENEDQNELYMFLKVYWDSIKAVASFHVHSETSPKIVLAILQKPKYACIVTCRGDNLIIQMELDQWPDLRPSEGKYGILREFLSGPFRLQSYTRRPLLH